MSETEIIDNIDTERDRGGRFVIGGKPGPGRPRGARSKFGEAFLEDLLATWNEHGIEALKRCATEDPSQFVRVCASLMPRDLNINTTITAHGVLENFRAAVQALGNSPPKTITYGRKS